MPHAEDDVQRFQTPEEAFSHLRAVGREADEVIDVGEAALALAFVFHPGISIDRFRHHLDKLKNTVKDEYQLRLRQKEEDSLALRVSVLRKVLHEMHGYKGDAEKYDDIQNANLIRVIERRKGLPVALGILYIVVARAQGWGVEGLNFPGHFVVRLDKDGERIILNPFEEGKEMNAADLRGLLKSIAGKNAELSHQFYEPVSNRDMLVRLQNNLKKRLIDKEDYTQTLLVLETMEAIAPEEYRVLFDKGVLLAKLGQNKQAIQTLTTYIERAPNPKDRQDAQRIIAQLTML